MRLWKVVAISVGLLSALSVAFSQKRRQNTTFQKAEVGAQQPIERIRSDGTRTTLTSARQLEDYVNSIFRREPGVELMVYTYQGPASPGLVIIGGAPNDLARIRAMAGRPGLAPRVGVPPAARVPDGQALKRLQEAQTAGSKLRAKDIKRLMQDFNRASAGASNPELSRNAQRLLRELGKLTSPH